MEFKKTIFKDLKKSINKLHSPNKNRYKNKYNLSTIKKNNFAFYTINGQLYFTS